jgi:hypothetical protein
VRRFHAEDHQIAKQMLPLRARARWFSWSR